MIYTNNSTHAIRILLNHVLMIQIKLIVGCNLRKISRKIHWLIFISFLFFRDDVQQLFREKDRDFDGYLSFEEFTGQETKIEMAFKVFLWLHFSGQSFVREFTMRKNLPKTLDQLIFCKYTLVFSKCSQIY